MTTLVDYVPGRQPALDGGDQLYLRKELAKIARSISLLNQAVTPIGDYLSAITPTSSAINMGSGTPVNVASIILPAGDWQVTGAIVFSGDSTTAVNKMVAGLSTSSGVEPALGVNVFDRGIFEAFGQDAFAGGAIEEYLGPMRFNVTTTTTVYLVANMVFSGGTSAPTTCGGIQARRWA